jgi:hypothetical protein
MESAMFYDQPIYVGLSYAEITKEPVSRPQEAEAIFQINGKQEVAFVPLYAVNEEDRRAFGAIIGAVEENEEKLIVEFPPTTLGQSRFTALKSDLDSIAIYKQAEG